MMVNEKRLIDAYKLEDLLQSNSARYHHKDDVIAAVAEQPTVDAVEVVRCKICRYYKEAEKRCDHPCLDFDVECYDHWLETEPDDFCSYGERREGE